ncbi:hypothetical protein PMAYCL1PPCAC_21699, partial [Pristionchus mayeri]
PGFVERKLIARGVETTVTVPERYGNLQFVSAGCQGIVVSATDSVTGNNVAIKKILEPFRTQGNAQRPFREIALLSSVKHPNIIPLFSVFTSQQTEDTFQDIYLVMELMPHNLKEVSIKSKLDHKTLSFFFYQILCAVNHLHKSGIIHRDLNPCNIAVNGKARIKVLDFGLARNYQETTSRPNMTAYVVTRYYRAPEILLAQNYGDKGRFGHLKFNF